MENLVPIFLLIPLLGFLANGLVSKSDEQKLSQVTSAMLGVQFLAVLSFTVAWLISGHDNVYKQWFVIYESAGYHFYVDLYFDEVTAVFLAMGSMLAFLITTYSRNYLLHESGYKRFFTTVLFFFLGYNIVVLSGNLTTVLVGWEFVGVSSFLLIAYYRNRFIPVKNAIKIFSLYRIGDIALLLSLWFLHQMVQNQHVTGFKDLYEVVSLSLPDSGLAVGFGICILLAAAIKSAQFPFSAWLPRAMEGPTPSSAIFYTSLAVHLGVFLLLRTYDFWVHIAIIRNTIIAFGIISFLLSSFVAGSQHSIKGQIAYAVVAQVGLMFVEVALGYHWLVLIHLFSHAMFRSYQMLISPSFVAFSIRRQLVAVAPRKLPSTSWVQRIYNSLYVLSLNEWYQDRFIYNVTWGPFKSMGERLQRIRIRRVRGINLIPLVLIVMISLLAILGPLATYRPLIGLLLLIVGVILIIRIFAERERLLFAWYDLALFHLTLSLAFFITGAPLAYILTYLGGIMVSYVVGHLIMDNIRKKENIISLHGFRGHCYEYPNTEFWFFVASLALMGFPISPAFIGVELLLNGISAGDYWILTLFLLAFWINGLVMIRMYSRVFLGPHVKTYHTQARKTS